MTATRIATRPRLSIAAALGAAALFGLSVPAGKALLTVTDPWLLAGLLYLGSGVSLGVKSQEIVHSGALCKAGCRQTTSTAEEATRMDAHKNARTTPYSRALIAQRVRHGQSVAAVARAIGVCDRTVRKWIERHAEGELALADRSCRPHRSPRAIGADLVVEIERLRRRYRWMGADIARAVGVSRATVARTLRQLGVARLNTLEPPRPVVRYEWPRPGQMLHLDIKKLGRIARIGHRMTGDRRDRVRGAGWEYVHVCVDDCSRVAYAEVLGDERGATVAAFLRRAVTWFCRRGVQIQRVLTDNGTGYRSKRFAAAIRRCRLVARRTRPYTPRTNGKAERFIKTMLREWAYAAPYATSAQRTRALLGFLHRYNWHRQHDALGGLPPISRVVARDDLLRLHT